MSDVCTCMIHDLCAGIQPRKVERRITRILSKTLFSGMEEKSITIETMFGFLEPNLFVSVCNRPTLPFHVVNQRVDNNRQPHVIQRYHVPSPRNDQYCRHDQAVYSMWMHFVIFCSMEVENLNRHRHAVAEIAAFAHPGYKYPLESSDSMILPSSSSKDHQSKNLHTGHQQCFFYKGTLAVNPFTNVSRLDVFKNLSCGEGSQLLFSTRESTSCSPSVSSKCPTTRKSSPSQVSLDGPSQVSLDGPSQVSLDGRALPQRAYAFPRNHLQPHFSSEDLRILNPHHGNYQPLHFDDTFTPCKFKNLLQHMGKDIEDHNFTVQHSNFLPVTSHSYFNEKAGAVSAMGLGCKAIHVNRIVHSRVDHLTSFTGARAIPKSSFLSHSEERKPFEWEMGKITDLKAGQCTFNMVKKGSFDTDEELKRSPYDLIDVDETSPPFNTSRSPAEDNIELSFCDLEDNYLSFSPVAGRTAETKSLLNFEKARPTDISNISCYSPSSVCSILKGSTKNIQSLDSHSNRRQFYGKRKQLLTQLW